MKIISFILASLVTLATYAHEPLEISVSSDTTIYLREALSLQNNEYLYGEKFDGEQRGGKSDSLFNVHQISPNKHINGITINRDSDNKIYISVKVSEIGSEQSLTFKYAIGTKKRNRNNKVFTDWNPNNDDIQTIMISSKSNNTYAGNKTTASNGSQQIGQTNLIKLGDIEALVEAKISKVYKITLVVLLVWFIALFIIVRIIAKRVDARINSIKNVYQAEIENIEKQYEHVIGAFRKDKRTESSCLTFDDIRNYVDRKIDETIALSTKQVNKHQDIHTNKAHISTSNETYSAQNVLSTDNVIYNMDSNTFHIGETDIKIFRIYSQGGEYFYNIIDNPNIREEFISMIASYANCISIIDQGNLNAKSVEPIKAGKLIRNGNSFIVDQNNKLELRLI